MSLFINGSNREKNCYTILKDMMNEEDKLISLASKHINYCLGCNACMKGLKKYCVLEDDMQEIYKEILETDKIVIATPIYMNHITGILKNVIDRLNPYSSHEDLLKGKTIYLITVGQMNEKENKDIAKNIQEYFESIGEFMEFKTVFLKNFTSGDIKTIDDIKKMYKDYEQIIENLKEKIERNS